jgi:3-deoxy-D-manno-octulosonic-acid transferase
MRAVYTIIIILYTSLIRLVSPFNRKAYLWTEGRKGWKNRLKENFSEGDSTIWIHCASLGEFEQGRPLIERIKELSPGKKILVTFFSPSGYEIRKNSPFADYVSYLPADTPGNAAAFIEIVRPQLVLFIKYEFWANFLTEIRSRGIPLYLVSGIFRPGQHFFRWYGSYFRKLLDMFTFIYVQDSVSADMIKSIGIDKVSASGDTRFDRVARIAATAEPIPLLASFAGDEKVFIAGSSWPQDEEIIAEYINRNPLKMKWIFAPHEINEAGIIKLQELLEPKSIRYSDASANLREARVLIIDNIGKLSSAYRYAYISAVGGGFGKGIHNILEPACWKIPVLFGPNHLKFREAVELRKQGAAFSFRNKDEFNDIMTELIENKSLYQKASEVAGNYIGENIGATEKIVSSILRKDINI